MCCSFPRPVARLLLALLVVGWIPVRLARSESVKYTAFLVIRLVGGLFSFPLVPVVRMVHFARCSTVPTGPAAEKMLSLVNLVGSFGHNADSFRQS